MIMLSWFPASSAVTSLVATFFCIHFESVANAQDGCRTMSFPVDGGLGCTHMCAAGSPLTSLEDAYCMSGLQCPDLHIAYEVKGSRQLPAQSR